MEELREASIGFQTLVLTKSVERTNLALAVEARAACVLHETADSYWLKGTLYGIISRLWRGYVG
jgi:hypothetical protein